MTRCDWAGDDPLMVAYHDDEWGVPSHEDAHLFEMLTLEGAQSGLSWTTILRKREGYRAAFKGFDVRGVARFTERDVERLMQDASIVRNRAKIESTIANARATVELLPEYGSLDAFVWELVGGKPQVNSWKQMSELPSETPASRAMSKELKRRGFRFLGPTTCYAFMQAVGMVDDHVVDCFRRTGREP